MAEAHWEHVLTDAGHHLRLRGANGETILTSEVYEDGRSVPEALAVVRKTGNAFSILQPELVDERSKP